MAFGVNFIKTSHANIIHLFILGCISSCSLTFKPDLKDRIFFKKIKTPVLEVEWYTYSAAWADSPDIVTVKKENILDTVCISDNIADINVIERDKVVIGFYGSPEKYMKPIVIHKTILGYPIKIDTSYVSPPPHARNGFKNTQ